MSYKINIDTENKIIRYQHSGNIDKENIGKAWSEFLRMKEFTELQYNLLSDYSEAKFNMVREDVDLITNFLLTLKDILKDKKQALIIDEPFSTALSILFQGEVNRVIGFEVRIFSTKEAAFNWLII